MPEFAKAADDVLTDEVLSIRIDKEAMQKSTDIHISVEVLNKDPKQP